MQDLDLKTSWKPLRDKLQKEYPYLTDEDLAYVEGKEAEFYGRLQEKLGKPKPSLMLLLAGLLEEEKA